MSKNYVKAITYSGKGGHGGQEQKGQRWDRSGGDGGGNAGWGSYDWKDGRGYSAIRHVRRV